MSDTLRECLVSVWCLLRHVPLFLRHPDHPKTPLRVLGIVAFDVLHVLRTSRTIAPSQVADLAAFLDFEGCANAEWDNKAHDAAECSAIRRRLEAAGRGRCVDDYLHQLREHEGRRPAPGGDQRQFADVRAYREAVARLSLSTAAGIVHQPVDANLETLFRILMQCQIVDDVLDYSEDVSSGLPSFVTATDSRHDALAMSAAASADYSRLPRELEPPVIVPFRVALAVFSLAARAILLLSPRAHRTVKTHAPQRP